MIALPVSMLIQGYLNDYVNYQSAGNGAIGTGSTSGPLMLPGILPVQYVTTTLSVLRTSSSLYEGLYGGVVLFLIGALVAGTDWGRGTVKTALLAAAAVTVVVMFGLAAGVTAGFAAVLGGTAPPVYLAFPSAGHLAIAMIGALLVALACAAIGLALGTIVRSATKAVAFVLLWGALVMPTLDQVGSQVHGICCTCTSSCPMRPSTPWPTCTTPTLCWWKAQWRRPTASPSGRRRRPVLAPMRSPTPVTRAALRRGR